MYRNFGITKQDLYLPEQPLRIFAIANDSSCQPAGRPGRAPEFGARTRACCWKNQMGQCGTRSNCLSAHLEGTWYALRTAIMHWYHRIMRFQEPDVGRTVRWWTSGYWSHDKSSRVPKRSWARSIGLKRGMDIAAETDRETTATASIAWILRFFLAALFDPTRQRTDCKIWWYTHKAPTKFFWWISAPISGRVSIVLLLNTSYTRATEMQKIQTPMLARERERGPLACQREWAFGGGGRRGGSDQVSLAHGPFSYSTMLGWGLTGIVALPCFYLSLLLFLNL